MNVLKTLVPLVLLAAPLAAQELDSVRISSGFIRPIYAASPPGDFDRIFVAEQAGRIRIIRNGSILPTPFLNLNVRDFGNEQGLLGLAFHPEFATNGTFFVNYTRNPDGATVVERYRVSSTNPDVADASSRSTVLGPISQPFSNHNAGCLQFGPDGFLYVANGDGGSGGDPGCRAQNGSSLLGKMLRLDVDQNPNGVGVAPASNPFVGTAGFDDRIWAYGLRNPWRFSFDRENGDMWIGDVGQNSQEEVDYQPGTSTGGENYGWKVMEGTNCFGTSACGSVPPCNSPLLTDPVRTLPTSSFCSVVGGYVYRGDAMPSLRGTYFHADYCTGRIWSSLGFQGNGQVANLQERTSELGVGGNLWSFGEDAGGEILICAGSSVYRIEPVGLRTSSFAGQGSVGSNGETPIHELVGRFSVPGAVTLRLRNAPEQAAASLAFGFNSNPINLVIPGFGTLIPNPIDLLVPVTTDANGEFRVTLPMGPTPTPLFHQVAIFDAPLGGVTLSNALQTLFFEVPPPVISMVDPVSPQPGQLVTVMGENFAPGLTLTVDGQNVTPLSVSATDVTFTAPASVSCDTTVVVENAPGQSAQSAFNPSPVVTNTFFGQGPVTGGGAFLASGSGFAPGTTVTIGGNPATITALQQNSIFCQVPPGAAPGVVQVVITTPYGCTTTTTYTYL